MDLQVGVKVLLKNPESKYLLLSRNFEKYQDISKKARWDIVGGRINPGAPLIENLKREVFEESGLTLMGKPVLIAAQDIIRTDKHVVRLTYICETAGEPKLSDEHDGFKWFSAMELAAVEDLDPYLREVIAQNLIKV